MSRQYWTETVHVAGANGAAVVSTSAETIIFPDVTIPANYMRDGRVLRVMARGKYSNTSTPTLIFSARWGGVAGTLLCKTAACTTPSGVTDAMWQVEFDIECRANGASGSLMANGQVIVYAAVAGTVASATGNALVTPMTNGGVVTPAAVTVDLTVATALSTTLTWSASSGSNSSTGIHYSIEALN